MKCKRKLAPKTYSYLIFWSFHVFTQSNWGFKIVNDKFHAWYLGCIHKLYGLHCLKTKKQKQSYLITRNFMILQNQKSFQVEWNYKYLKSVSLNARNLITPTSNYNIPYINTYIYIEHGWHWTYSYLWQLEIPDYFGDISLT